MDDTPDSFAYRCLPLNIANAHGWEVLNPHGLEAIWNGGRGADAVTIRHDAQAPAEKTAVSIFGQGVLTFHVYGIFRTPPGWNLWVGGSPNRLKDAIQPLTGIVETDWSPFTFTMNWRFTRPHTPIRFEANEPFCFVFPLERAAVESFKPQFAPMANEKALEEKFQAWSQARDGFHEKMRREPAKFPSASWQKHYYRGTDVSGQVSVEDHRAKLRLKPFDASQTPDMPVAAMEDVTPRAPAQAAPTSLTISGSFAAPFAFAAPASEESRRQSVALAKREWLLETLERQRELAWPGQGIERYSGLTGDQFLKHFYAVNRPVVLRGEMASWPALSRWTPEYLKSRVGPRTIEFQGGRKANPLFELQKDVHRRQAPFDAFVDEISRRGAGNDAYITAYNSARNSEALTVLHEDLGRHEKYLDSSSHGMMWIGPAGTLTALHHDLTNNFIAQLVGRKEVIILPASEVGRLYNNTHVFSDISDLSAGLDLARYPRLAGARFYRVILEPGEVLFMPLAWWHQVKSLDFSVTITYTNFRWPNNASATYPTG